ncbi:MAG: hypothetical protein F4Y63_05420 [Chloroflexi bacterium]|nr:hypothetical protein [Chloroflexota bacterium]MYF79379.1 hypothetical protein [Chloroflexota bacterium]
MIDQMRSRILEWDWRLFSFIILFLGLPNVYQLYRVRLIGNEIPDSGSLAIVSQWQFVGLVVEVFQEASVLAIFFFLGSQLGRGRIVQLDRAKSVMSIIFVASLIFSIGIFLFRDQFITLIGTSDEIQAQTRSFLGINIFSVPFSLLAAAIVVLFQSLRMRRYVFLMAIVNVALQFALDSLLFGGYAFSLDAGVIGVGWSTLLSSAGLFAVGLILLILDRGVSTEMLATLPTFADMKDYLRVGLGSGTDSLVRNVAYFVMIVRIVNTIGSEEIGGYYLAIQVLWSFMLVPVLALADTTKALVANSAHDIPRVRILWYTSMGITACMILIWLALVPLFPSFANFLSDDETTVSWAITAFSLLFVPYVLFCFNTVSDGVFYGVGQTKFMAYQSLLTNGTVYLVGFVLYALGIWEPTFQSVMLLFSLGILVDSILTILFLLKVLYLDTTDRL